MAEQETEVTRSKGVVVSEIRFITIKVPGGDDQTLTSRRIGFGAEGGNNLSEGYRTLMSQVREYPDGLSFLELQERILEALPSCGLVRVED